MKKSLDMECWRKDGPHLEMLDGEPSSEMEEGRAKRRPAPGRQTLWAAQPEAPASLQGLAVPGKRALSQQPAR